MENENEKLAKPYLMAITYAFVKLAGLGYVKDGKLNVEFMNVDQHVTIDAKVTIDG